MNVEAAGHVNVVDNAVTRDEAAQAEVVVRGRRYRRGGLFHGLFRRLWVSWLRRPPRDTSQQPVVAPTLAVAVPIREDTTTSNHGADRRVGLNHGDSATTTRTTAQATLLFLPRNVLFEQDSPYLMGLIREGWTCASVLCGAGTKSCVDIVRVAQRNPRLVHYKCDRTGRLPIHQAALQCCCIHVFRTLVSIHPMSIIVVDDSLDTPLHLLFRGIARRSIDPNDLLQIMNELLSPSFPMAAGMRNRSGDLPLHVACRVPESMVPICAVERLLDTHPLSVVQRNGEDRTPLHVHCQRRPASVAVAQCLLRPVSAIGQDPNGPTEPLVLYRCSLDADGKSELHYAALWCHAEIIPVIVAADPNSASLTTLPERYTALHLLCLQHPSEDCLSAVQCLLEAASTTATVVDTIHSSTSLHLLLSNVRPSRSICPSLVQEIVNVAPQCLGMADRDGYLPLHHAAQSGADRAILEGLLRTDPRAATALTRKRDSALSLACSANVSDESVRVLLDANLGATSVANDYGFLPLHCVCRANAPLLSIVHQLVEANPLSIHCLTNAGELPVHLANGAGRAVLALLTVPETDTGNDPRPMTNKVGNTPCKYCFMEYACTDCDRFLTRCCHLNSALRLLQERFG
jgi:ankyrin repeat protein